MKSCPSCGYATGGTVEAVERDSMMPSADEIVQGIRKAKKPMELENESMPEHEDHDEKFADPYGQLEDTTELLTHEDEENTPEERRRRRMMQIMDRKSL